jgi:hypothetical protein
MASCSSTWHPAVLPVHWEQDSVQQLIEILKCCFRKDSICFNSIIYLVLDMVLQTGNPNTQEEEKIKCWRPAQATKTLSQQKNNKKKTRFGIYLSGGALACHMQL